MWVRRDGAFEAIVPLAQFIKAQHISEAKCIRRSDEEMLECLRQLWARAGKLSADLINEDRATPCADSFKSHFKALTHAYSLIGYEPNRKDTYGREKYRIRQRHRELFFAIKDKLRSYGATVEDHGPRASILINGQFTANVVLCYCCQTRERGQHWSIRLTPSLPDVTIAARLKPGNMEIQDYYLFPNLDRLAKRLFLTKENQCRIDVYRFESLDFFLSLGRRCNLVGNA
jgi:hypothetical protein